jgi:HK97 family phage prohead protease
VSFNDTLFCGAVKHAEFCVHEFKRMDFILNDETVINSHGLMVMNAGGRLGRFKSNPVMLFGHDYDDVLGSWDNLRVEAAQIKATPKFDMDDDRAARTAGKVERGFIRGASMGIIIHRAELKYVGDDYIPVITDWTLLEASIVSVPSNEAALSLMVYNDKGEALTAGQVKLELLALAETKNKKMDKIVLTADAYTKLGVESTADGACLSAAIMALHARAEKAEKELNDGKKAAAETLVDNAIMEGRLTADRRDSFVKMAASDHKQAADIIAAIPAKQSLAAGMQQTAAGTTALAGITAGRENWNYMQWLKEDNRGLLKLKAEHPETFDTLKTGYGKA